ncbi:hypothetical protein FGO68_gene15654 [Halteria grandinella]|uniref:GS catalytic domain-containing protein n=1 Tax=Halteria grandinella TaxID=5974 RepID=A0A8J8T1N1_HALGN|nr:hypothetical protein FGO68_gene15654 [Halteria grandinella]
MVVPDLSHENVYHDIKLVADKSSQRPCPWNPKLSIVFLNQQWIDGTPYDLCSRTLLQKAAARLRKEHGLEMRAGIELEFILVRKVVGADGTPDYVPIDSSGYACAKPLATWEDDLLAIEEQFASIGIEVEQIHHEASQGQFEFAIKYTEVVRTIENYLIARMVIQKQFEKKGIIVSFVPKMSSDAVGNGAHVHLSLWKIDGVETPYNIVGDKSTEYLISEQFQSFMAGIKHHLPALAQFMAPTPNSIKRICESGHWAGNYIVWGYDNKEAVLRIQSPASKEVGCTNLELKTFDHTSNIFLGLANVIVCGLDGMKKNMKLPAPVASDPGEMTSMERETQGIQMMPMNIKERKDILLGDGDVGQPIREFMGIKALENYLAAEICDHQLQAGWCFKQDVECLINRI